MKFEQLVEKLIAQLRENFQLNIGANAEKLISSSFPFNQDENRIKSIIEAANSTDEITARVSVQELASFWVHQMALKLPKVYKDGTTRWTQIHQFEVCLRKVLVTT